MIDQNLQKKILQSLFFLIILSFFIAVMSPFWMPILMACIFAMGIEKTIKRIYEKYGYEVKINLFSFFGFLGFCIFLPLGLLVMRTIEAIAHLSQNGLENNQVYESFLSLKTKFFQFLSGLPFAEEWGVVRQIESALQRISSSGSGFVLKASSAWLAALPDFLVAYVIFLLCLFVMLKQKKLIRVFFLKLNAFKVSEADELIELIKNACYSTLISAILIGFIQASIVSVATVIFSAGDFWLVLMITFCFSFIPAIGAAPVAFALALPFFLGGQYFFGIAMCIVGVVTGTIDNILRPILVGGDQDIHPLLLFLATIGGIIVFGIPGLFIGPVAAIIFVKALPLIMENLLAHKQ